MSLSQPADLSHVLAYIPAEKQRRRFNAPGLAPDAFLARLSYQVRTQGTSVAGRFDLARQRDACRPGMLLWDYTTEICRRFGWGFHMQVGVVIFYRSGFDPDRREK